jgi:hypothetical protein
VPNDRSGIHRPLLDKAATISSATSHDRGGTSTSLGATARRPRSVVSRLIPIVLEVVEVVIGDNYFVSITVSGA